MQPFLFFIRHIDASLLRHLFTLHHANFSQIDWEQPVESLVTSLEDKINEMGAAEQSALQHTVDRIQQLIDHESEQLLVTLSQHTAQLRSLNSSLERSCWVYLHERDVFNRTEAFCSKQRGGHQWSGYQVARQLSPVISNTQCRELSRRVSLSLGLTDEAIHVHVSEYNDAGQRVTRIDLYEPLLPDVQLIHREQRDIRSHTQRLLQPFTLIYHPNEGGIDVVAADEALEFFIAHTFADVCLNTLNIVARQFTFASLKHNPLLHYDDRDHITSVTVVKMILKDGEVGGRVALALPDEAGVSLQHYMEDHVFGYNPLSEGVLSLQEATISIQRLSPVCEHQTHVLPMTLSLPNKCDLLNRTRQERGLGQQYLQRWGFIENVS